MPRIELIQGDCLEKMKDIPDAGKMAKQLNRNFIGIELDPTYFAIAEKRINATAGNSTATEITRGTK